MKYNIKNRHCEREQERPRGNPVKTRCAALLAHYIYWIATALKGPRDDGSLDSCPLKQQLNG